ncbi:MAG TPA: hypothetical protein ENJ99_06950, partial [Rhizobiales bacterium]|nr:hypothetical protein [Hyphomicrobiales bacterium]
MKPGIPWSVKGIESQTREAAKAAARRKGMTLGQWLNSVIQETAAEAAAAEADHKAARSKKDKKSKSKSGKKTARRKSHKARKSQKDAFGKRLDEMSQQLARLAALNADTSVARYVPGQHESLNNDGLNAIIDRLEASEERTREAMQAVYARLEELDEKVSETRPETPAAQAPASDPAYQALEGALRNIVEHIETSERRNREALQKMQDRISQMATMAQQAENAAINANAPVLAGLEQRVAQLASQMQNGNEGEARLQSYVDERLAGISEQIDALRLSSDASAQKVSAAARQAAQEAAKQEARQVEQRVASLVGEARTLMIESTSSQDTLEALRNEIGSLNQRFDDIKTQTASERDVENLKLAVEELSSSVLANRDDQPVRELEQRLAQLTKRLDETGAGDHLQAQFNELDQRIQHLGQQLQTAIEGQNDRASFELLESQISAVADRINATEEKLGNLGTLEQSIARLYASVEENHRQTQQIADDAAS